MKFVDQITSLRSKMPIGIKQAIKILETNDGNVERSIEQAKMELATILMEQTGALTIS